MTETITIGPFSIFFTNHNQDMGLPGHSHFATVKLRYRTDGPVGFPAFEGTYAAVQDYLKQLTSGVFRQATNEEVARRLFAAFDGWSTPAIDQWRGQFTLLSLDLNVRGVPDKIGHADGFTTYGVSR